MGQQPAAQHFKIHGMDCAKAVAIRKREVGPLVGGADRLGFDVLNGKMSILSSGEADSSAAVVAAVARTRMRAEPWQLAPRKDAAGCGSNALRIALTVTSGT